jgi:DNA-binding CsgD family transcriptional regulator
VARQVTAPLSEKAARLYENLLVTGGISLIEHADMLGSQETQELIEQGFARASYVTSPRLVPIEPGRAVDNAILVLQQQTLERYRTLMSLRENMHTFQEMYLSSTSIKNDPQQLVRVLNDRVEIEGLSAELPLKAKADVAVVEIKDFARAIMLASQPPSAGDIGGGVRARNIYDPSANETSQSRDVLRRSATAGFEHRVHPGASTRLMLIDDTTALLSLDRTGMERALLVRAPLVLRLLRNYFEMLWNRAIPVDGLDGREPAGKQHRILHLMLIGMTDGAIARHLGVSERTVRRHIGVLMRHLNANNRIALAVAAIREGWIDQTKL